MVLDSVASNNVSFSENHALIVSLYMKTPCRSEAWANKWWLPRHTAVNVRLTGCSPYIKTDTIVSRPDPNQLLMMHTSDFMIMRWNKHILTTIKREIGKPKARLLHIGERQETQILKFNPPLPPPPPPPHTHTHSTHLVCNAYIYLIANFLSFHMSLVIVMNCGAGNVLRGFEISMFYFFLNLYSIHISKDILLLRAQNTIKQCKLYFCRKPLWRGHTVAPYIMHDF